MNSLYHYTSLACLPDIQESGCLRRSPSDGLLWLSPSEPWEQAAGTAIMIPRGRFPYYRLTFDEQDETIGCARFVLSVSSSPTVIIGWELIKAFLRHRFDDPTLLVGPLPPPEFEEIYGNPLEWRATISDIDLKYLQLEVWNGKWESASLPHVAKLVRAVLHQHGGQYTLNQKLQEFARQRAQELLSPDARPDLSRRPSASAEFPRLRDALSQRDFTTPLNRKAFTR